MTKSFLAIVLAGALAISACSGTDNDEASSGASGDTGSAAQSGSVNLDGAWKQTNSNDDESWMEASIQNGLLQVEWVFADEGRRALYWVGDIESEVPKSETTVFESTQDKIATGNKLMAAQADTKEFTYKDGVLSFDVSMLDLSTNVEMERTGDLPPGATFAPNADDYSFSNGVLTTPDMTITITDYRVIPVGEVGNEYGDVPVMAFYYDITNNTDENMDSFGWISHFSAVQDNDPNVVNELNVSSHPDPATVDTQMAEIKPGGTLSSATGYELSDGSTPLELIASPSGGGAEIGRQSFPVQ